MVKTNILIIGLAILCYGCKPEIISPTPESGEVDASHFICIGGNEMAGYLNGALFYDGQQQSLAKLLSNQLKKALGLKFNFLVYNFCKIFTKF